MTGGRAKELTIILHEDSTLTGAPRTQINARKKNYVRFLESSFREAIREGRIRPVDPKVAAYSLLGTVNWIYKWFRPDGEPWWRDEHGGVVCQSAWQLHSVTGCPFRCDYCWFGAVCRLFVNLDEHPREAPLGLEAGRVRLVVPLVQPLLTG